MKLNPILNASLVFLGLSTPALTGASPSARTLDFPLIQELLERHAPTSVEALLEQLKDPARTALSSEDRDALFQSWVAIYQSKSRHQASMEHPRFLLRSSNGRFLLAFATLPKSQQFHTVELIQQNPVTRRWDFAEIQFDPSGKAPGTFRSAGSGSDAHSCTQCHQGHPLWHSYRLWPGAFKSNDDETQPESKEGIAKDALITKIDSRKEPRTQTLGTALFFQEGPPTTNTEFSITLGMANFDRVAKLLVQSPNFRNYRFALLATLQTNPRCMTELESFLPEGIRKASHPKSYASLLAETKKAHAQYYSDRKEHLGENAPDSSSERGDIEAENAYRTAGLRYLAQGLGLKRPDEQPENWSLSPTPGVFAFETGLGGIEHLTTPLLREWAERKLPLHNPRKETCEALKQASLGAFAPAAAPKK